MKAVPCALCRCTPVSRWIKEAITHHASPIERSFASSTSTTMEVPMKAYRNLLSIAALGVCGAAFAAVPFDLDRDGLVTARDINQAASMLAMPIQQGGLPLPGSTAVPVDFNGDRILNLADWTALTDYVAVVRGPRMLFDTRATGTVDARAKLEIVSAIGTASTSGCCYQLRYDFNGDGVTNIHDWKIFLDYLRLNQRTVLLDFNIDNQVTGADLDILAGSLDRPGYDLQFDLNADGRLDAADWTVAVGLLGQDTAMAKPVFDVDAAIPALLSVGDGQRISQELSAMLTGWRPSIRYDLNGDGKVDASDWSAWVQFAFFGLRTPDLVLDVDGSGAMNTVDLSHLQAGHQARPTELRYDLNGDRVTDARDVALLRSRLVYGPPVFAVGDVNRDGCVDSVDIAMIQAGSGRAMGMPGFNPDLDVDRNNYIDVSDVYRAQGPGYGACQ
jgi:hypothetical protein